MRSLVSYLVFTRLIIPWIVRMIASVFWFSVICVAIFWSDMPQKAERLATAWWERAMRSSNLQEWDTLIHRVFLWCAWITIIAGWIVLSWLTLTILRWIL